MSTIAKTIQSALVSVLRQEGIQQVPSNDLKEARALLGDVLIASNRRWKQETLSLLDTVWQAESEQRQSTKLNNILVHSKVNDTSTSVLRGDITSLAIEAIVNAANDQGLGCFQPSHRCIDNVIHRQAGPRLRLACQDAMKTRKISLAAGTEPIVTGAFFLPSTKVIHVTGPQILHHSKRDRTTAIVSATQRDQLAHAYSASLDEAARFGVRSIAFPCISTGLFGFPSELASEIAISTVKDWLERHPGQLDHVVFNVFAPGDEELYLSKLESHGEQIPALLPSPRDQSLQLAKAWIDQADAVLIVAGAGMSVKPSEMVYTNPGDFAKHYPWFVRWGYKTNYECMGLISDNSVPENAKWALHAKHMDNMRWRFTPNEGYNMLRQLVGKKDYFVLTSNVDGCFERAGFSPERIYTPQGEWTYLQCTRPCASDSVFEARPYLDNILPHISSDGTIPKELVPKCPRCGSAMFGNVRGGSWFLHHKKYQKQNAALQAWMQEKTRNTIEKTGNQSGGRLPTVAVVEIGAGFNTPTVTRFPAEAFVRELGDRGSLIRINPSDPEVPNDLMHAVSVPEGWQALLGIASSSLQSSVDATPMKNAPAFHYREVELETRKNQLLDGLLVSTERETAQFARFLGGFDWRIFLDNLNRD